MQETEHFAARHALLSEELTRLYALAETRSDSGSFSADVVDLNSRICELQRDVLAKIARQAQSAV